MNMGHGTAWGGRLLCTEDFSRVRIPDAPPHIRVKADLGLGLTHRRDDDCAGVAQLVRVAL